MKIQVMWKDPDVTHDACEEAAKQSLADLGLDEDEMEPLIEKRTEKFQEMFSEWVEYGEYITFELDTDTKQIRVVPLKEKKP